MDTPHQVAAPVDTTHPHHQVETQVEAQVGTQVEIPVEIQVEVETQDYLIHSDQVDQLDLITPIIVQPTTLPPTTQTPIPIKDLPPTHLLTLQIQIHRIHHPIVQVTPTQPQMAQ